ncbi:MAG: hypothetical protein ABIO92_09775 [Chloroflexia bacterium]
MESFYATAASLCFTLLGFWWAVVQFRHHDWMANEGRRRMAYSLSLHFFLPGIMCLVALVPDDARIIRRITFGLTGLLGLVATVLIVSTTKADTGSMRLIRVGEWLIAPLYAIIVLLAINPGIAQAVGIGLKPLEVEGLTIGVLLFLGVNLAWILLAEPTNPQMRD